MTNQPTQFLCKFSANDADFPFTVGKIYASTDSVKGFNHLSTHILADNGNSVKVETLSSIVGEKRQWAVKDHRDYSKFMNYAGFELL